MKKIVSLALVIIMMLTALTVFVSAEDTAPAADNGAEYLLALWDFENPEKPYDDIISNALIWARNGVDNAHKPECMEVKDGVVEITAESNMLYLQYAQRKQTGYEGHENKTIFIKFYITGTALNNDEALIWHRNNDFKICVKEGATAEKYAFICNFFKTEFEIPEENTPAKPEDKWYYMALTMGTYDEANAKVTVNIYLSADGTNYKKTTQEIPVAAANVEAMLRPTGTASYFSFGKTNINYGNKEKFAATTGVVAYYDEIRFYNVALADEQMVFLKDTYVAPEPGETTEELPIVTRPPAPTATTAPATEETPKTTEAPSTAASATTGTPGATTEPAAEKKGGCKGMLTSGALVLLLAVGAGAVMTGKKRK